MLTTISLGQWMSSGWALAPAGRRDVASRKSAWSRQVEDVYMGRCDGEEGERTREKRSPGEVYLENAAAVAFLLVERILASGESTDESALEMNGVSVTLDVSSPFVSGKDARPPGALAGGNGGNNGGLLHDTGAVKFVNVALRRNYDEQSSFFRSLAAVAAKLFTRQESLPGWGAILSRESEEQFGGGRSSCGGGGNDDSDFESDMLKALSVLDTEGEYQHSQRRRHSAEPNTISRTRSQFPSLPNSICRLIADLIDGPSRTETSFASLGDVLDDLEQMARDPDTFLHDPQPALKLDFGGILHGRKKEVSQLMDIANGISSRKENEALQIITIGGYSGSGKSFLVRQVGRYLSSKGWIFIQGKFDRMRQSDAFSVVTSALESYCEKIVAIKNSVVREDLDYCRQVLNGVMGALGHAGVGYLSQIIPSIQNIVELDSASQSDGSDKGVMNNGSGLPPSQTPNEALMSRQRREYSLCAFVDAISGAGRPIMLFYDDIQWADPSSCDFLRKLLKHLADRNWPRRSIVFALTFRDNEVNETDPLHRMTSSLLNHDCVNITNIQLDGFSKRALNNILSPVLGLPCRITFPLSEMIHQKTTGNVFFVIEFMKTLESPDKRFLAFSLAERRWVYDADSIAIMTISDSVAGLLVKKLLCIERGILDTLIIASCFGSQVNTTLMELLDGMKGVASMVQNLDAAVDEGLVEKAGPLYMFSHDSIQQSVYELIPRSELLQLHVDIGQMLISCGAHASRDIIEEIFSFAVSHINMALPGDGEEVAIEFTTSQRIVFAKLNLKAGQKAAGGKSDFTLAGVHLKAGISFLPEDSWADQYDLTLQIFDEYIYVLFVQNKLDELRLHVDIILEKAKSTGDKIKAHRLMITVLTVNGSTQEALDRATSVLDSLGFPFPQSIDAETVSSVFTSLSSTIMTVTPDRLRLFPLMSESVPLHAMKIMGATHMPFSLSTPTTYQMMACQMIQLTIKHGLCMESAEAFANFGYCVNALFRNYDVGYRLGKLSLVILERFRAKNMVAKCHFLIYGFLSLWKEPIQATVEALRSGVNVGLLQGDYQNSIWNQVVMYRQMFIAGFKLSDVRDGLLGLCRDMMSDKSKQKFFPGFNASLGDLYSAMSLIGETEHVISSLFGISSKENEEQIMEQYYKSNDALLVQIIYYHRLIKSFWFRDYESAIESCEKYTSCAVARKILRITDIVQIFFFGLSSFILSRKSNQRNLIAQGEDSLEKIQAWANAGSKWNAENKALLLEAEYKFAKGDNAGAKSAYEKSIKSAHEHKFIHEEALAQELYGIFCVEVGDLYKGNELLERALELYEKWGAKKKADAIFPL